MFSSMKNFQLIILKIMKIIMNFLLVILRVIATENIFTYIVVLFSRYVFIYSFIYLLI